MGMGWDDFEYRPRPTVGALRQLAAEKVRELNAEGLDPQPITGLSSRGKIAKSFWGHAWCRHLEMHCDYENRLPRGRSYVRNGAVVHLEIDPGEVIALVMGSELYELSIRFDPLDPEVWRAIQKDCRGQIGSLVELLQGKLSDRVMDRVTDPERGLFPQPGEMHFNCNCLDWADMCKHVAAALYGVGVRLDSEPELLFRLRGVDQNELIDKFSAAESLISGNGSGKRRTLDISAIHDVFGIEPEGLEDLANDSVPVSTPQIEPPTIEGKKQASEKTAIITGPRLRWLREAIGLNGSSFARQLGVSPTTLANWERQLDPLPLKPEQEEFLQSIEKDFPLAD